MKSARMQGFTLLEVMVAVLVLMTGLVAVAGLQTISASNNHSSFLRSQAIIQAHDMSDRMHANSAGVLAGAYNSISEISSSPPTCLTTATSGDALDAIDCSTTEIAQFDSYEWNTANATLLPSGTGTVAGPDGDGIYTITLSWREIGKSSADMKNFQFRIKPLR
jgi:type IV pilus assembly protein PilV